MKRLAVKIDNKNQFDEIIEHNLNNGYKMIGGVNAAYNPKCNVVELGSHYRVYSHTSPYAWTNKVLTYPAFRAFIQIQN